MTDELCHIAECLNHVADGSLSIARARVEPGVTTRWHLLEGEGLVEVGDSLSEIVRSNEIVVTPPGVRQRIQNTGTAEGVFLALCTPRFQQSAYRDVES